MEFLGIWMLGVAGLAAALYFRVRRQSDSDPVDALSALDSHPLDALSPVNRMTLKKFRVISDEPGYLQHYFKFKNEAGEEEEFLVVFTRAFGHGDPIYSRTQHRMGGKGEYATLGEPGPWSLAIGHLLRLGEGLEQR